MGPSGIGKVTPARIVPRGYASLQSLPIPFAPRLPLDYSTGIRLRASGDAFVRRTKHLAQGPLALLNRHNFCVTRIGQCILEKSRTTGTGTSSIHPKSPAQAPTTRMN
jgi:hypothetical protein